MNCRAFAAPYCAAMRTLVYGLAIQGNIGGSQTVQAGRCPWCRWGHVLLSNWIGPADPQTALELQGIRYGSRDLPGQHDEGSDGDEGGGHYPLQAYLPEEPLLPPSGDMVDVHASADPATLMLLHSRA